MNKLCCLLLIIFCALTVGALASEPCSSIPYNNINKWNGKQTSSLKFSDLQKELEDIEKNPNANNARSRAKKLLDFSLDAQNTKLIPLLLLPPEKISKVKQQAQEADECVESITDISGTVLTVVTDNELEEDVYSHTIVVDGYEYPLITEKEFTQNSKVFIENVYVLGDVIITTEDSSVSEIELSTQNAPDWWASGLLDEPLARATGNVSVLLVRVQFSDSPFSLTFDEFNREVVTEMREYYNETSYGKLNLTVDLYPDVVNVNENANCTPFSGFRQILPLIDPNVNFNNYEAIILFSDYLVCPWCGIAAVDLVRNVETDDGGTNLGMSLVRNSCAIDGRKTEEHELGHILRLGHAGRVPLRTGFFDVDENINAQFSTSTYGNPRNPMGASSSGGHFGPLHKAILKWLEPGVGFLYNPPPGTYTLSPISTSGGLKSLIFRRSLRDVNFIEFRKDTDQWEHYRISSKGDWNNCVFLLHSDPQRNYAHENSRVHPQYGDCVPVGVPVLDPGTGLNFTVTSIDPTVINVINSGTPDLTSPTSRFVAPAQNSYVSGVVNIVLEVSDPTANLEGSRFRIKKSDNTNIFLLNTYLFTDGNIPGPNETANISLQFDTRQYPDGQTFIYADTSDKVGNKTSIFTWFHINNSGGPTTTTTTSTSTTTTTSTINPNAPVAKISFPTPVVVGEEVIFNGCTSYDPNDNKIKSWYWVWSVPNLGSFATVQCLDSYSETRCLDTRAVCNDNNPCAGSTCVLAGTCEDNASIPCTQDSQCEAVCGENQCVWENINQTRDPCKARFTFDKSQDVEVNLYVQNELGIWSLPEKRFVTVTLGGGTTTTTTIIGTTTTIIGTTTTTSSSSSTSLVSTTVTTTSTSSTVQNNNDVFVTAMQVHNRITVRSNNSPRRINIYTDASGEAQYAIVKLEARSRTGVVEILPDASYSVEYLDPNDGSATKTIYSVTINCLNSGTDEITWEASVVAQADNNLSNNVLTQASHVRCR